MWLAQVPRSGMRQSPGCALSHRTAQSSELRPAVGRTNTFPSQHCTGSSAGFARHFRSHAPGYRSLRNRVQTPGMVLSYPALLRTTSYLLGLCTTNKNKLFVILLRESTAVGPWSRTRLSSRMSQPPPTDLCPTPFPSKSLSHRYPPTLRQELARQELLNRCHPGQKLLMQEPTNGDHSQAAILNLRSLEPGKRLSP